MVVPAGARRPLLWALILSGLAAGGAHGWAADTFDQDRQELRQDRQRVTARLDKERPAQQHRLAKAIDTLLGVCAKHPAAHQRQPLADLIEGLTQFDAIGAQERLAKLHALPALPSAILPADQRVWDSALATAYRTALGPTRTLIQEAIDNRVADAAGTLLRQYLVAYPDDPVVHQSLGQTLIRGQWYGPRSAEIASQGSDWDPKLGWVLASARARYDTGEYCDPDTGQWSSMQEADQRHASVNTPWVILTEHLQLQGNAHHDDLIACANHLEAFYQQIFTVYAAFFCPDDRSDLRLVFAMADRPRLVVNVERNLRDYRTALPVPAGWSAGMYVSEFKASYFYAGNDEPMYHEFTHQILGEYAENQLAPAWLVEGVAVYSQAPVFVDGTMVLGHIAGNSWIKDYIRELAHGQEISLDDLLALTSGTVWAAVKEPIPNYAAAGTFLEFLMEAKAHRYRADLVDFIRDSYLGVTGGHSLFEYLGISHDELVSQFNAWARYLGDPSFDPSMDPSAP